MQLKKLIIFIACGVAFQTSWANITIHSKSHNATDFCGELTGSWAGGGNIITQWAACTYKGTAIVAPAYANGAQYNISMDMNLVDGICPPRATLELPAKCENNALTVDTDNAEMTGSVDATGKTADMDGTIYVDVGGRRVEAELKNVHLVKQ